MLSKILFQKSIILHLLQLVDFHIKIRGFAFANNIKEKYKVAEKAVTKKGKLGLERG